MSIRNYVARWPDTTITICQAHNKRELMSKLDAISDPYEADITELKVPISFDLKPEFPVKCKDEPSNYVKIRAEDLGANMLSEFMVDRFADVYLRFSPLQKTDDEGSTQHHHSQEMDLSSGDKRKSKSSESTDIASKKRSSLEGRAFADISDDLFPAHVVVLAARSSRLRTLFTSHFSATSEGGTPRMNGKRIIDICPCAPDCTVDDFKAMLFYMYSGRLPTVQEQKDESLVKLETYDASRLLALADEFEIDRLRDLCEREIATRVFGRHYMDLRREQSDIEASIINTYIDTLIIAKTYRAPQLEQLALYQIAVSADLVKRYCLDRLAATEEEVGILAREAHVAVQQLIDLTSESYSRTNVEELRQLERSVPEFQSTVIDSVECNKLWTLHSEPCGQPINFHFNESVTDDGRDMMIDLHRIAFRSSRKFWDGLAYEETHGDGGSLREDSEQIDWSGRTTDETLRQRFEESILADHTPYTAASLRAEGLREGLRLRAAQGDHMAGVLLAMGVSGPVHSLRRLDGSDMEEDDDEEDVEEDDDFDDEDVEEEDDDEGDDDDDDHPDVDVDAEEVEEGGDAVR